MTPAHALELLLEAAPASARRDGRGATCSGRSGGRWPFAADLGCIDARVPAELVFDQGIGDLFNVRIAGDSANEDILGSLEFACEIETARATYDVESGAVELLS